MNPAIQTLIDSFNGLFVNVIMALPNILVALALIGLGWLLGSSLEKIILSLSQSHFTKSYFNKIGLASVFSKNGIHFDFGAFSGVVVKWFVFIAFLLSGFQIGGVPEVGMFVNSTLVTYIPKILSVVIILFFAMIGSRLIRGVSYGAASSFGLTNARFPSMLAGYAFTLTALVFIVLQLGIDIGVLRIIVIGIVSAFSIAFGLAFGLGGKEVAGKILEKMYKDINKD